MSKIHVILMGGEIDTFWDKKQNKIAPRRHTCLTTVIPENFRNTHWDFSQICLKDGRDLDLRDLQTLSNLLKQKKGTTIIIQGITTIADTYDYLLMQKEEIRKTVLRGTSEPRDTQKHIQSLHSAINVTEKTKKLTISYQEKDYTSKEFREILYQLEPKKTIQK